MEMRKKGLYNILVGFISQLIILGLGIVIPRLFLINFGSEVNGLISSIGQFYSYVSLLEAGVGLAAIQILYKPVKENNKDEINYILSATGKYYRKIGIIYILVIFIFAFTGPLFIKTTIDNITVIILIFLSGSANAINFFLQNIYTVLLRAEGKNYINSGINTVISILTSISKVILLFLGFNILVVLAAQFLIALLRIIIYYMYVKHNYKWINLKINTENSKVIKKNDALVHEVSYFVFSNTDVLFLTLFTDLKVVSVYVIYNMLIGVVDGLVSTINNSLTFIFGQTYCTDRKRFSKLYDAYEVFYMALVFGAYTLVYLFMTPFLKVYTNSIGDINYVDQTLVLLFVMMKLLAGMRTQCKNAIYIAGHFKETKMNAIIETIINLVVSIVLVRYIGIYGVVIGSISGLLVSNFYTIYYSNKYIIERSPLITFKRWSINLIVFFMLIIYFRKIPIDTQSYLVLFGLGILFGILILIIYVVVGVLFEKKISKELRELIKPCFKRVKHIKE